MLTANNSWEVLAFSEFLIACQGTCFRRRTVQHRHMGSRPNPCRVEGVRAPLGWQAAIHDLYNATLIREKSPGGMHWISKNHSRSDFWIAAWRFHEGATECTLEAMGPEQSSSEGTRGLMDAAGGFTQEDRRVGAGN